MKSGNSWKESLTFKWKTLFSRQPLKNDAFFYNTQDSGRGEEALFHLPDVFEFRI